MQRKTDTQELDIPKNDIECWERYPKHRWVYELSRLLDSQNIDWSPYKIETLTDRELNIDLMLHKTSICEPGYIYTKKSEGRHIYTELYITKGEIKLMRHIDPETSVILDSLIGEVELRLNAFVTLYFQKFTGVITTETYANEIFRIRLRPYFSIDTDINQNVSKLIKRIYKRSDILAIRHYVSDERIK